MTLYIVNASYKMSLEGCSLNGIADIFPQTSQITSGEPRLSFFAKNLCGELGSLRSELLWSIMRKLTPCCRNEDIFAQTLFSL